jgi:hypothetical protein
MLQEDKLNQKKIIDRLNSGNNLTILETIRILREIGNSFYIPDIVAVLKNTKNKDVQTSITNFLFELKDNDSAAKLVDEIKDLKNRECLNILVPACWENGLNYNQFLSVFVDLVISQDFQVAFDAFTVIENMQIDFDPVEVAVSVQLLKDNLNKVDHLKKLLFAQLIDLLLKRQLLINPS